MGQRLRKQRRWVFYALWLFSVCGFRAHVFASDPAIVEAAKKEGGEIEAYVTLRTDTAQMIWKLFEAKYPFLRVKQYKADSDKMLERLLTEYRDKKYIVDVLNFGEEWPLDDA